MVMSASSPFHVDAIRHAAGAAAFTGGAAVCLLFAGASAQASADSEPGSRADSETNAVSGPTANGASDKSGGSKLESATSPGKEDEIGDTRRKAGKDPNSAVKSNTAFRDIDASVSQTGSASQETDDRDDVDEIDGADDEVTVGDASTTPGDAAERDTPDVSATSSRTRAAATDDGAENDGANSDAATADTEPTAFAALARATADPEIPNLFEWVQRTFFNRTPTVSSTAGGVMVGSDGSVTGKVMAADADGDVLTYRARPLSGRGGTVTIGTDGTFRYTPPAGVADIGGELFRVTVSDRAPENGWHVHGLLGLLVPGWGSTASRTIDVGPIVRPVPDPSTAAGRYGWGTPRETRFTDAAALSGWGVYNSVGHNGYGRRTPAALSFVDGVMVITGDAAGNTGGLAWNGGQKYGAWEVRLRVPRGAADYHAVALLWPDAENWPVGGEIDFVEILGDSTRQNISHFLHYSAQNRTESAVSKVDATQWHNYAVSWTPQAITVYVDGTPAWTTTNAERFPPGPMHLALQLDASEKRPITLSGGAQMMVAWARQYPLSAIT
ncbi:GH16 domain-containing protein [Mycobacterium sp. smrl_JER01]